MKIQNLFRWIAILPASLIAAVLGCLLLMVMVLIGDLFSGEIWIYLKNPEIITLDHFFLSFILFAAFGYIFVTAGVAVSPAHKRAVAFVLFTILTIAFGFLIIFSSLFTHFSESWRLIINCLISIVAAGVCSFAIEENNESERKDLERTGLNR